MGGRLLHGRPRDRWDASRAGRFRATRTTYLLGEGVRSARLRRSSCWGVGFRQLDAESLGACRRRQLLPRATGPALAAFCVWSGPASSALHSRGRTRSASIFADRAPAPRAARRGCGRWLLHGGYCLRHGLRAAGALPGTTRPPGLAGPQGLRNRGGPRGSRRRRLTRLARVCAPIQGAL